MIAIEREIPIDVWVADNHPIVRAGLRQIMASTPLIRVVGESNNAHDLLDSGRPLNAHVLLMDATMPGPGVFEVLDRVTAAWPAVRTIVLGDHAVEHVMTHLLQRGAAGYLSKEQPTEQMLDAIVEVASGLQYVPPSMARTLLSAHHDGASGATHGTVGTAHGALSGRELQVFRMLGSARSTKEIAADLSLSPKTVSTYRARIREKTGLRTSAQVIRYVLEGGLSLEGSNKQTLV